MSAPNPEESIRQMLARQLGGMRNPYASAVLGVNQILIEHDVPLSDASRREIVHNANRVETGEISPTTGSLGEVPILLREARTRLRQREVAHGALFALGAVLNSTVAPLVAMPAAQFNQLPLMARIAQVDADSLFPGAGVDLPSGD